MSSTDRFISGLYQNRITPTAGGPAPNYAGAYQAREAAIQPMLQKIGSNELATAGDTYKQALGGIRGSMVDSGLNNTTVLPQMLHAAADRQQQIYGRIYNDQATRTLQPYLQASGDTLGYQERYGNEQQRFGLDYQRLLLQQQQAAAQFSSQRPFIPPPNPDRIIGNAFRS